MARIARPPTAFAGSLKAKPEKAPAYIAWIRTLPCVISGRTPVEAAHISFANLAAGATGRGMSQKASDRFALPLHADVHRLLPGSQHNSNEREWWDRQGVDPHFIALALFGAYSEESRDELARHILSKAWRF